MKTGFWSSNVYLRSEQLHRLLKRFRGNRPNRFQVLRMDVRPSKATAKIATTKRRNKDWFSLHNDTQLEGDVSRMTPPADEGSNPPTQQLKVIRPPHREAEKVCSSVDAATQPAKDILAQQTSRAQKTQAGGAAATCNKPRPCQHVPSSTSAAGSLFLGQSSTQ